MSPETMSVVSGKLSVRLALGELNLRARLKFIWYLVIGKVVQLDGSVVLSTRSEGNTLIQGPTK